MLDKPENGDAEFEKLMNSDDSNIKVILYAIKEKMGTATNLYNSSLDAYLKLEKDDPLKKKLFKTITNLAEYSIRSLNQFDYVLMDEDEKSPKPTDDLLPF